jgi:hypothetical protein
MPRPPHPSEQGFLIVGVVIFVLALTIIGLSLFSLSSFEAQFLGTSTKEAQAFYAATGGIERAMNVLGDTDSLQSVTAALPLEHVIYARARYWNATEAEWESTGVVPWSGDPPVEIRVVAEYMGARRVVEATYRAHKFDDVYANLVTTPTVLRVLNLSTAPPPPYADANTRTYVTGRVVSGIDDDTWTLMTPSWLGLPREYEYDPTTPGPAASEFIALHSPAPEPTPVLNSTYVFGGIPLLPGYKFFKGGESYPGTQTVPGFAFYNEVTSIALDIPLLSPGRAIWLLEGGGHFWGHVNVTGPPGSTLIIVATQGSNTDISSLYPPLPNTGLWFQGGISSDIPLILVSDGTIAIDHYNANAETNTDVDYLSMFAGGVLLKGPRAGYHLRILHLPSALVPPLTDLDILGPLYENNLLPNSPVSGTSATFTLEPGTWREVTESNPS